MVFTTTTTTKLLVLVNDHVHFVVSGNCAFISYNVAIFDYNVL